MEPPKPQEGQEGWPNAGASRSDVSDSGSRLPLLPRRELPPLPDLDEELLKLEVKPAIPPPPRSPSPADLSTELGLPGLPSESPKRLEPPAPGRRELPPLPDLEEELKLLGSPTPVVNPDQPVAPPAESKLPPLPDLDEELRRLEAEAEPALDLESPLFPEASLPPLPDLEEELRRLEEVPQAASPLKPLSEEERFRALPPLPNLEDELLLLDPGAPLEPKKLPPLPDLSLELERLEKEEPKAPPLPAAKLEAPTSSQKNDEFEFPSLFGDESEPSVEPSQPAEAASKPALGLPSFFDEKIADRPKMIDPPVAQPAEKPKKLLEPPPPITDPTPFNHSTKIAILKIYHKQR